MKCVGCFIAHLHREMMSIEIVMVSGFDTPIEKVLKLTKTSYEIKEQYEVSQIQRFNWHSSVDKSKIKI